VLAGNKFRLIPLQAQWTVFVLVHLANCFAQITLSLGRQAGDGMSLCKVFRLEMSLPRGSCNRFGHPIHSQIGIVLPNVSSYDVELPYDWILLFELSGRCGQQLGKGKVVFVVSVLYDFS